MFDFGQNMAGLVEIRLPKLIGDRLVIRYAETLDKDGNFYTENLRTARCTDTFVYEEKQVGMLVMPHFTFHGFRYICVEGAGTETEASDFTACAMHTDMQPTGTFTSDNTLVNQLQSNIQWGQRGNFLDVPTDCPQRDERLGWTGDAQVFCGTASYNFHTALFFRKWLQRPIRSGAYLMLFRIFSEIRREQRHGAMLRQSFRGRFIRFTGIKRCLRSNSR